MTSPYIILGEGTSDLMLIEQAVMTFNRQEKDFTNNAFNHPTLAKRYKNAAFDGINRLG
jgi:NAD(P) transhydrogenase